MDLLTTAKATHTKPQLQPAHPDWIQEQNAGPAVSKDPRAQAMANKNVVTLEAYNKRF